MRKTTLCCLLLLSAMCRLHAATDPNVTQVHVIDNELAYVGPLNEQANQRLFELYDNLEHKPKVLAIQSEGGEVATGMALGTWVRAHQLDVKVTEYCLSSCANYVFPSGARKIVSNVAVVGYHGGANSLYQRVAEASNKMLSVQPQSEAVKNMTAGMLEVLQSKAQQELAYLEALGVSAELVSLGQHERYQPLYKVNPNTVGWTYSVDDFARMGVRDIVVINPPWAPKLLSAHEHFFMLPLH